MKRPIFELSGGHFGERGWERVSFWKWLWMASNYVNRVRWVPVNDETEA